MRCTASTGPRSTPLDPALRAAYLRLAEQRFGLRLTRQQTRDLDATIEALRAEGGAPSGAALYATLASGQRPDLLESLAARLTVGETHFFRIRPQIEALRDLVLPDVIARHGADRRLRLWSAGCSTGEETYTLAILLREALPNPGAWRIELVGTDISRPALDAARRAVYGEWSFRDTPRLVRQRYFTPEGERWRLIDSIRRMTRFVYLNLAAETRGWRTAVGTSFDLILCRNVTIYFGRDTAQALYRELAAALVPGGWLVLGPSDPAPELAAGLDWVFAPNAVLWRRPAPEPQARTTSSSHESALQDAHQLPATGKRIARTGPSRVVAPTMRAPAPTTAAAASPPRAGASGSDPVAARAALERRVAAQPLDDDAHLQLGLLDLDSGAAERAVGSLRRATFLAPENALAHYSLGRAWQQLEDVSRARAALVHARRLLASLVDDTILPSGQGLRAAELRQAVAAALDVLERGSSPAADDR